MRDWFVAHGYHRRWWNGWMGGGAFCCCSRQRKLREALHKKAERGSVSEILMRPLPFLLQQRSLFFKGPPGKIGLAQCYASSFFMGEVSALDSEGGIKYCLPKNLPSCHTVMTLGWRMWCHPAHSTLTRHTSLKIMWNERLQHLDVLLKHNGIMTIFTSSRCQNSCDTLRDGKCIFSNASCFSVCCSCWNNSSEL